MVRLLRGRLLVLNQIPRRKLDGNHSIIYIYVFQVKAAGGKAPAGKAPGT